MDTFPPAIDLSQTPLAAHPSGIPPNFADPPSLIAAVQAIGITLGLISFALVVLRLAICYQVKRPIGLDDGMDTTRFNCGPVLIDHGSVCVVIAFVLAAGYTGISCSLDKVTRHAWDTPLSFLDAAYLKKLFVTSLFYGPMLFFAKASILFLYYRAFHPERWLRIATPGLVQAGMNMAADVTIFLLPLPIIAKLHIPMGKKIALAGVFATGVL
ncbi:hypothetical protein DL765_008061 [Monosporascus sp. GIB2]|nr:hypothetical protein DL765_008061 [Monosporascus sp. GIB2]